MQGGVYTQVTFLHHYLCDCVTEHGLQIPIQPRILVSRAESEKGVCRPHTQVQTVRIDTVRIDTTALC